jgi:putative DNA primase/helicase
MDDAGPFSGADAAAHAWRIVAGARPDSEDALALRFTERHAHELLYVQGFGTWLHFDGCRWAPDDVKAVHDVVRTICREAAHAESGSRSAKLASYATLSAVERMARSDPRHARRPEVFDADPFALNTPGGVVDLHTGVMRPQESRDLHTKATAVAPGGGCPRWLKFLDDITQGDQALIDYLQRFIGYTLTGTTREQVLIFLRGPGGNGKSVLMNTVAAALGDYATIAMSDVVTVGRNDQHPTHLASLRGARMIVVPEVEEGKPWAEARLKAMVAGDKTAARVMRGDPFEFQPVGKWWIAGNHSPVLRNPDPAMRRRLQIVPLTYVPAEPDPELAEALKAELPGILAWAIRGCLDWQREGLQKPPPVVAEASADYFTEQDGIAAWFAERCEQVPHSNPKAIDLYSDWKRWSAARGADAGSQTRFAEALGRLAAKKRTTGGIVYLGLRLRPLEPDETGP